MDRETTTLPKGMSFSYSIDDPMVQKMIAEAVTKERQAIAEMVKPVDESLADEILARGQ